jgi:hypothetical protein
MACDTCGFLCEQCDTFLHLNKRAAVSHHRQVRLDCKILVRFHRTFLCQMVIQFSSTVILLKSSQIGVFMFNQSINLLSCEQSLTHVGLRVDVHEGCSRARLPSMALMVDGKALKAVLEVRHVDTDNSVETEVQIHCRFCGLPTDSHDAICNSQQCQVRA